MSVIIVKNAAKMFKVYHDRAVSLKEKLLFKNRSHYETRWVLNDISFEVQKGEAIGIIGQNGCGKSTMLKLMTQIMYPDKGYIEIQGRISSLIELGAGFHPDMSGRENIYTNASIFGLTRKEINKRVEQIIDFSEIREFIDNPVRTYSSGMYMRLAFSVAIHVDADVLLIDEILAVGDANFQSKCFNKMREMKAAGTTIVIVTHDTNTVEKFCNHAIWINDGLVYAKGSSHTVVAQYLKFMNEKYYINAQLEEKQKNMEQQDEEPAAEETAKTENNCDSSETHAENHTEDHIEENITDDSANRFGLRHVEITNACFINQLSERTNLLKAGESVTLEIAYKVHKAVNGFNLGMGFYTLDYQLIYGTNTTLDGKLIKQLPETGVVRFIMDNVELLTGRYILQLAIVDDDNVTMDWYRNYFIFDVVSDDRAVGMFSVKHNWIIN